MKRILPLMLLMMLFAAANASAAPVARPFTGIGLLFMRTGPLVESAVSLYHRPGVGQIKTMPWTQLPSLGNVLKGDAEKAVATVADKRNQWVLITYDDAGRKGWVHVERSWRYISWEEYLKGRPIRLLPGLRREFYLIRREPSIEPQGESLAGQELRVVEVREDSCLIVSPSGTLGWVRWRDPDGRILVSVEAPYGNKSN